MKFVILLAVAAVVAAAPYENKAFNDEFLDQLRSEMIETAMINDQHIPPKYPPFIILCRGLYDKNIAHPYNCNKYIACSNEKPFVMPCPSGLNYDPTTDRCEWPHIYPCHK